MSFHLSNHRLSKQYEVITLNIQYRMHPGIATFPSETFYEGLLKSGVTPSDRPSITGFDWPSPNIPVAFLNLESTERSGYGKSRLNEEEAKLVSVLLKKVLQNGLRRESIGVVTPYTAQVNEIKKVLKKSGIDVAVRTVDGFQGQERELIVFSCVRANAYNGSKGQVGFLDDENRMKVLLTRAKRGLIIIGHRDTLSVCSLWNKWLQWVDEESLAINLKKMKNYEDVKMESNKTPGFNKQRRRKGQSPKRV